ncbi:PadR family transcriptional regulator [Rhizobium leguminosarum]|uniref:PadR family transcriptional regulator n=1 Tax=Rhizobium leguminosarum TaxID=384 RepID=UPI002E158FAA|nr:helix-turn-helix transcriptional regulator [Rhizobium leguminosarum]
MLSNKEQTALQALRRAGDDSPAARIYAAIEAGDLPPMGFATLYTAIDRLVQRGFVSERSSEESGRRPKRLFSITRGGVRALAQSTQTSPSGREAGDGLVSTVTIH